MVRIPAFHIEAPSLEEQRAVGTTTVLARHPTGNLTRSSHSQSHPPHVPTLLGASVTGYPSLGIALSPDLLLQVWLRGADPHLPGPHPGDVHGVL